MTSSSDAWMREYNEALKLSEDINGMMSERNSSGLTGPDAQRRDSAIRRKITILGTRLDSLQSLLVKVPGKQHVSEKEMNRRKDMVGNLRSKANQVASALNMSNFANRDSLLGPEIKPDDAMNRVSGMDNQGIVGFQRQVMREQDEGLEKLEETVMSTKHIALAVNEELTLQTKLIIKRAEDEAESKYLSGLGIARQRQAIVDGLRDSVLGFAGNVPGTSAKDVLDMVMMTQYFDTMRDIGAHSKSSSVFIPHGPGAVADVATQIRNGLLQAHQTNA